MIKWKRSLRLANVKFIFTSQEGYQQKREAGEEAPAETTETADPMQGLEGLDVAGPKAA